MKLTMVIAYFDGYEEEGYVLASYYFIKSLLKSVFDLMLVIN